MQLLAHFKELTIHPKNAEELKGLILQLAVQGKLTQAWRESHPDVESREVEILNAFNTRSTISSGRKKFLKEVEKVIFPNIDFPNNWVRTQFFNLCVLKRGHDLPKQNRLDGKYPIASSGGISGFHDEYKSERGVVIGRSGSTGKPHFIDEKHWPLNTVLYGEDYSGNFIEYVYIFLQSFDFSLYTSSTAVPTLNRNKFLNELIEIPPLEEQKAIVSIVNQLFKEVEELEEQTKARIRLKEDFVTSALQQLATGDAATEWTFLQEHFKTFFTGKTAVKKLRESILQLAVQGKLTSDWRMRHPELVSGTHAASTLLEKIKAEKAQLVKDKKIKKEKPLPEIEEDEIPYELPEGWVWCRLGEITTLITDGKHGNCKDEVNSNYYFLSAKDVQRGNLLYDRARQINFKEFNEVHQRTNLEPGDLCIVNTGATVGKTAIALDNQFTRRTTFQKSVAVVKILHEYLDIQYLENFIIHQTPKLLKKSGGSAINNLLLGDMKEIITPLPPFEEQKAIVAKVNSLMALCDSLEKEIKQNNRNVEELMQSCLREVFVGEEIVDVRMAAEPGEFYNK